MSMSNGRRPGRKIVWFHRYHPSCNRRNFLQQEEFESVQAEYSPQAGGRSRKLQCLSPVSQLLPHHQEQSEKSRVDVLRIRNVDDHSLTAVERVAELLDRAINMCGNRGPGQGDCHRTIILP